MRILISAVAVCATFTSIGFAPAQTYPTRPITLIVPTPPGGAADAAGRLMAERMRMSLGQPVVVENVAGANGGIGTGRVSRAASDGYTVGLGYWNTHVANAALYALPYDVVNDFEPVSLFVAFSIMIVSNKTIAANDLTELIAWLKANPNKASQGSSGVGSAGHLLGVLLQKMTGTRFQHVPYRGSAPALQDLVAGQVDMMIDVPALLLSQVRAGSIKAYAVTAKSRLSVAPDIPTVDEAGFPGLYFSNWFAFYAPKGTPKDIIAKLDAAVVDTLADPTVRAKLTDLGFEIMPREQQTPEALAALHKVEIEKWWPIVKAANIKGE